MDNKEASKAPKSDRNYISEYDLYSIMNTSTMEADPNLVFTTLLDLWTDISRDLIDMEMLVKLLARRENEFASLREGYPCKTAALLRENTHVVATKLDESLERMGRYHDKLVEAVNKAIR
ncbi:MAG: hypothetical protein Q9218_001895 [Villophora microphyllina]